MRGVVRVKSRKTVTPLMVRITFDTADFGDFALRYPAHAVKLFVPQAGSDAGVARTYTVRRHDPDLHEMDVDFLLHGHGPAAAWAQQAGAGDTIELAGPRAGFDRHAQADWQLMIGDATAIPAIATMIESLPAGDRAVAYIAVRDAQEEQPITTRADARIVWVHVDTDHVDQTASALDEALDAAQWPDGEAQVFIAAESSVVRRLRARFPKAGDTGQAPRVAQLHATGYWKRGAEDYHDHH